MSRPADPSPDEDTAPGGGGPSPSGSFGPPAEPGDVGTLGRYRVVRAVGKGGMGAVYEAVDTHLGRTVALKVMLPATAADADSRERFLREARATARVHHKHVVTVYEAGECDGLPYIGMEFLKGYPLDKYLDKKGNPSLPQVVHIGRQVADGLAEAHRNGLVHRDIKPSNLWLEAPKGGVKILDFGLAKPVDADAHLTRTGDIVGTPAYMSPEQARGPKVDHRTDLFSLGAVLYRLCAGRPPYSGDTVYAVILALATEDPPPLRELNPAVPEPLADLIHRLLARNPDDRFQSAEEVAQELKSVARAMESPRTLIPDAQSQLPVVYVPAPAPAGEVNQFTDLDITTSQRPAEPAAPPPRPRPPGQGRRAALYVAALVAMVAVAVVLVVLTRDDPTPSATPSAKRDEPRPTKKTTLPPVHPDRAAAEWVFGLGGQLKVNHQDEPITSKAELPVGQFTLSWVLLNNKGVTDQELAKMAGLRGLSQIYLASTGITDAGLAHLKDCKALTAVNVGGTGVTDAGLVVVKGWPVLSHLGLGSTGITDQGLAHLDGLTRLNDLYLSATKVTDAGVGRLKSLSGLSFLQLDNTALSDDGLAHLGGLSKLTQLSVRKTRVTAAGVAAFHAKVPGCRIESDAGVTGPTS